MTAAFAVVSILAKSQPYADDARQFHDQVEASLNRAGWQTRREVRVDGYRGTGGRSGFLDLVATDPHGGVLVAIELDRLNPRRKSLAKLAAYVGADRLVVLRCKRALYVANCIAVVGMEVR